MIFCESRQGDLKPTGSREVLSSAGKRRERDGKDVRFDNEANCEILHTFGSREKLESHPVNRSSKF